MIFLSFPGDWVDVLLRTLFCAVIEFKNNGNNIPKYRRLTGEYFANIIKIDFTKPGAAVTYRSPDKVCALSEMPGIVSMTLMLSKLEEIGIACVQPVSDLSIQVG